MSLSMEKHSLPLTRMLLLHLYAVCESSIVTQLASLHQEHIVVGDPSGLARDVETQMSALSSWISY